MFEPRRGDTGPRGATDMPWSVRIVDERGKGLSGNDIVIEFKILDDLPTNSVMLRGIDPYGDTTFNGLQLDFFLREWDLILQRLKTDEEKLKWEQIRNYAKRCVTEPHEYLKFIG